MYALAEIRRGIVVVVGRLSELGRDAFFLKRQFTIITLTDGRTIRAL